MEWFVFLKDHSGCFEKTLQGRKGTREKAGSPLGVVPKAPPWPGWNSSAGCAAVSPPSRCWRSVNRRMGLVKGRGVATQSENWAGLALRGESDREDRSLLSLISSLLGGAEMVNLFIIKEGLHQRQAHGSSPDPCAPPVLCSLYHCFPGIFPAWTSWIPTSFIQLLFDISS